MKHVGITRWLALISFVLVGGCNGTKNPLERYGVRIEWKYGGATSAYASIDVWTEYEGQKIVCPPIFGGIKNPELKFRDVDGDGIEEIIFGNRRNEQIVSFKPAFNGNPPKFIVVKNDPESG